MSDFLGGKLDNQEIKQKLLGHRYTSDFKPTKKLIDDIVEQFWFHDFYNSFISDPIFLDYLIWYLNKKQPSKFNRCDFYDYLFDKILNNRKARTILQQFSLAFEKLQTDSILVTKLEKLSNLSGLPKELFPTLLLKENNLIKLETKENREYLTWSHHTLTEYLVAKYLLEKQNYLDEFQKLAILKKEGIVAFKPSWLGVLRFLLESKKGTEVITWFIDFLEKYKDNIDDSLSELLVFVNVNIPTRTSEKIFELIYNSYFNRIAWLPIWARNRLAKFVDEKSYKHLKEDLKEWSNTTETFVRRGNIVSIVEGLLENNSKLLTPKEKEFWKSILIEFAKNPNDEGNGVLQRHSLLALACFEEDKIIPQIAEECFEKTQDSLIRDGFIQFCINTAPNSKLAINYFIKGVKKGSTIYARHGFYKITKKDAIKYFLISVSEDDVFWKLFLKHESIFNKEDGDQQLIANIKKYLDKKTITLLQKIIFRIFKISDYYQEEKSNFIKQIILLINSKKNKFLFEILDEIKTQEDDTKSLYLFFDYKEIIAILLTPDNVGPYFDKIKNLSKRIQERANSVVYVAKRINGTVGQTVYKKAVKLKKVETLDEEVSNISWEQQQTDKKQNTFKDFQKLLEPSPGKYIPSVFEYYLQNQKELDEFFKTKQGIKAKKRLIKLAIEEGIKKINPKEFTVSIPDKNTHQFSWSSVASYYGDVLSVVKTFKSNEIKKYRQRIIDFVPYAFSDDMSRIIDMIPKIENKELEFVNKVMSDPKDDRRYLIPGTYIYLVGHYAKKGCMLSSVKPILKSFIGDKYIPDYEQHAALENLVFYINKKDKAAKTFLQNIFNKFEDQKLVKIANSLLISVYNDKNAIDWRFKQLKKPLSFEGRRIDGEVHEVGPIEDELDNIAFAKPLIELSNEKYLSQFLDLVNYSFKVSEEYRDKKYWEYINYLWRIVIAFIENLKEKGSFKPFLELEKLVLKYSNYENSNWLNARVKELRKVYIDSIGRIYTKP